MFHMQKNQPYSVSPTIILGGRRAPLKVKYILFNFILYKCNFCLYMVVRLHISARCAHTDRETRANTHTYSTETCAHTQVSRLPPADRERVSENMSLQPPEKQTKISAFFKHTESFKDFGGPH